MAATKQPSIFFFLLALITLSSIINSSNAADCAGSGAISVYWGQGSDNVAEGTLEEACATGNYSIMILNGLIVFDDGTDPKLNLGQHCGSASNPCTELQSQIEYCQKQKNMKVFLSINKDMSSTAPPPPPSSPSPSPSSSEDEDEAKKLADYLYNHFLSGQAGPLGNVSLDGIDLGDVADSTLLKWDKLVTYIHAYSTSARKIYISASPECVYPDYYLNNAIGTGLIDYIWVEFFYQNPCIYSNGDATNLLKAWETWTSSVPNSLIFLGLAASEKAVSAGYIPPDDLKSKVLPTVKKASNYGGVMIWDRYYDKLNNYTGQIKDSVPKVCKCVCDGESASTSFYI